MTTILNPRTVKYFTEQFAANVGDIEKTGELLASFAEQVTRKPKNALQLFHNFVDVEKELYGRVNSYNEVIYNTLRKLPSGESFQGHFQVRGQIYGVTPAGQTTDVKLLADWLAAGQALKRDDLVWFKTPYVYHGARYNGKEFTDVRYNYSSVPAYLLWNDPVAVAQHVRTTYPELMQDYFVNRERTLGEEQSKLSSDFEVSKKRLEVETDKFVEEQNGWVKWVAKKEARKNKDKGTLYPGNVS